MTGPGGVLLRTDIASAEMVKLASNAFLATKISFINAMAEVCEQAGADVIPLAEALGYDARIGRRFLIFEDGRFGGTIGGGPFEAFIVADAGALFRDGGADLAEGQGPTARG